jgi:hypothetical protein
LGCFGKTGATPGFDVGGSTQLSTDGFSYEVGGLVQSYTNALGGVTTTLYTSTGQPRIPAKCRRFDQWLDVLFGWTHPTWKSKAMALTGRRPTTMPTGLSRAFSIRQSASPLATNTIVFDRRGNETQFTDAEAIPLQIPLMDLVASKLRQARPLLP